MGDQLRQRFTGVGVLNALRHQRGKQTRAYRSVVSILLWCSTPCGIRGENNDGLEAEVEEYKSAQRLAASEGKTIKLHADIEKRLEVLNALRHQRGKQLLTDRVRETPPECSTPCGIRGENNEIGALMFRAWGSAQRLAASEGKTIVWDGSIYYRSGVLNALRHQRGKQPPRTPQYARAIHRVLNALRHQRGKQFPGLKDSEFSVIRAQRLAASEGKTTDCSFGKTICDKFVLNALRHQRGKQTAFGSGFPVNRMCSTPCGIRGENNESRARAFTIIVDVLNALRHQRGKQAATTANWRENLCAQRLAASEGKTTRLARAHCAGRPRAQRLAASEGKTRLFCFVYILQGYYGPESRILFQRRNSWKRRDAPGLLLKTWFL